MGKIIRLNDKLLKRFGKTAVEEGNATAVNNFSPEQLHQIAQRAFELGTSGRMDQIGMPVAKIIYGEEIILNNKKP